LILVKVLEIALMPFEDLRIRLIIDIVECVQVILDNDFEVVTFPVIRKLCYHILDVFFQVANSILDLCCQRLVELVFISLLDPVIELRVLAIELGKLAFEILADELKVLVVPGPLLKQDDPLNKRIILLGLIVAEPYRRVHLRVVLGDCQCLSLLIEIHQFLGLLVVVIRPFFHFDC
jgi:hypothetical protein